jgi:hypothetical protein
VQQICSILDNQNIEYNCEGIRDMSDRKYENACIYSIRSHNTEKIFIGSTTSTLASRMAYYIRENDSYQNGTNKRYHPTYEILKCGKAYVELVEKFPCKCKDELTKRENEIIRESENCINKESDYKKYSRPKTEKELTSCQKAHKKYYETHKELFLKYSQRKEHCEICNKDIQKNYFKKHCQTQAHIRNSSQNRSQNRSTGLSQEESDSGSGSEAGSETENEIESD